ncbi:hypothetical protein ACEWY4_012978 [Coilia grayii]|uniref:Amino acid transporter transmembrane domain-containing protein n=1 Tax=Coilia grayii TaxID=363190 RepID=A0ABD1JV12_9TELE
MNPSSTMEAAPSEMNTIPNGKGHEAAGGTTSPAKSPAENTAQDTVSSSTHNSTETAPSSAQTATETVLNSTENTADTVPNSTESNAENVPNSTQNDTSRPEDSEANLAESHEFLSPVDDKKTPRFTDFEGKTSFGMSVFNLGNAIMGSGILGLAYAMANTGIILFLFLLTAVAGLSSYSIHLLLKCSGIVGIRAYEQLGFRAFGTPGKMAAGIAITLQNIGAMSSYLYIIKYELPLVIQAFCGVDQPAGEWYLNGNYLVMIVSISMILPLALMKQLGYLGYTSGFSLSCMVFFLIAVIYKKFQVQCPFVEFSFNRTATVMNGSVIAHARGVEAEDDGSCVPLMFNLNTRVLPIYTELRNPTKKKMQHVSNISIAVMYTMYFLAALFGYLTFYGKVEAELLHTYSTIDPYDTLILCVRLAVLTAVTLTVPIVLFPVRRAIQQMLFPNKTFYWPRHIAIAFVLLTLINLLVILPLPTSSASLGSLVPRLPPVSSSSSLRSSTYGSFPKKRSLCARPPRSWRCVSPSWVSCL